MENVKIYGIHIINKNTALDENNPHICIGWSYLGDLSSAKNEKDISKIYDELNPNDKKQSKSQNVGQINRFVNETKIGDLVVYRKHKTKDIYIGKVTSEYFWNKEDFGDDSDYKNVRKVKWIKHASADMFPKSFLHSLGSAMSYFSLDKYSDIVNSALDGTYTKESIPDNRFSAPELTESTAADKGKDSINKPYSENDFLNDVFISKEEYVEIHELLERKKNIILQGAPGVGKTFMAKRIAYAFMGEKDDKRIEMVQFHQSYSYEDFVFGYQPNGNEFKLTPGIFYTFCKKASEKPDKPYFFIIDEINRGNLSKIFGELLMLIENDKRGTSSLTLSHTKETFTIPRNLYIIGMMNTADRSLSIVDYALRRRFSFIKVKPAFETSSFRDYLKNNGTSEEMIEKIITRFSELNNMISNDSSLGDGFAIGHSYFCDGNNPITDGIYKTIIKYDIAPILDEYWFDNPEKAKQLVDNLLK